MALTLVALLLFEQHSDRLIHRLGADDYAVREAATARLLAMGRQQAAPILGRARVHRDPEVRARARAVMRRFNSPPPAEEHRWALYVDPFEVRTTVGVSHVYHDEDPISVLSGSRPNDASIQAWIEDLRDAPRR